MSQEKQLAEQLFGPEKSMGALEALKQAVQAIAPGLDLQKMGQEIGGELKQMGTHGAHELAAALFNGNQGGSAFVMYPRGTHDDHGIHGPEGKDQEAVQ